MRTALAVIVLALDLYAIVSILGARRGAGGMVGWLAAVVLLPFVGALGWIVVGRRRSGRV